MYKAAKKWWVFESPEAPPLFHRKTLKALTTTENIYVKNHYTVSKSHSYFHFQVHHISSTVSVWIPNGAPCLLYLLSSHENCSRTIFISKGIALIECLS